MIPSDLQQNNIDEHPLLILLDDYIADFKLGSGAIGPEIQQWIDSPALPRQVRESAICKILDGMADPSQDLYIFWRLMSQDDPSRPVWVKVAEHTQALVRRSAASSPALPHDLASALVTDKVKQIREALASFTPHADIAGKLVFDPMHEVRVRVAQNETATSAGLLISLATDAHPAVRKASAGNSNMPQHILRHMSQTSDRDTWAELAGNHNCPVDLLVHLAKASLDAPTTQNILTLSRLASNFRTVTKNVLFCF